MSATLIPPAEAEDQQVKPASRRLGDYWLIGCVLLALACFAVPLLSPAATQQVAETLSQKPIEHIQVGDRVRAVNPNGEVDRSLGDQIQPEDWRHLKLRLAKANGGTVQIELLRPLRWVQARQAKIGQTIQLDLPEMDAVGKAEVLSLGRCPEISQGSGEVVTGTFAHEATEGNLLNVFVEGEAEPIGVTLHHPFWSETRGEFVAAEKLQPDEELWGREGDRLRVIQVLPRPGPERVYNLEVHRQHVYQIADAGIVVHNCSTGKDPPGGLRGGLNPHPDGSVRLGEIPESWAVAPQGISNVPGDDFVPNSSVSKPYARPSGAGPTAAQRRAVQGKPCVECGKVTPKQVADHKDPLVVQHYREGAVDAAKQSQIDAVQPHCPDCSAKQGGLLSAFSKRMKALLGL